ncbi:DUF3570 domain-containing protein [Photobacterium sp. MCCC 1A19761]|uniref:DUF3570 domain-containing protein n=1 Tax=Photobacterium sp. MCCC 1A19761 TaxID=3115000 RepID=UPI00307D7CCC
MSKKLPLTLLGTLAVAAPALGADHISIHHMNFEEYGDKIKAGDNILSVEKNFGVDWTITGELGYDSVSGASPAWGPTTPLSSAADLEERRRRMQAAQEATSEVIRAGYDPHRSGYQIQPYDLDDKRYSGSMNVTYRDAERREWSFGTNYSEEEDYESVGTNAQVLFYADKRKNRSYTLGGSLLFDKTKAFEKLEQSTNDQKWEDIFTGSLEAGLSQVFTPNFYSTFTLYGGYRSGYLSNHYLTVLREIDINGDGTIGSDEVFLAQDSRPDTRISGGLNVQAFYSVNQRVVVRPKYKFFIDDWGVSSHQLGGKMNIHLTDWLMLAPGYFWYHQEGANFYRDPGADDPTFAATGYATSDLRLGGFTANAYELGASLKVTAKLRLNALAAYYEQSNGYESRWWVLGATYEY